MKHKIEIIAELGINHCGDNELIKQMIEVAAECGADTVKIQLYDPRAVFGDPPREPDKFSQMEWEAIYAARLGRRQAFWIKEECERAKVNFLAAPSDLERLQWLEDIGVDRYKIASDDALNEELCVAINGKGKPIIISDGCLKEGSKWKAGPHMNYDLLQWLYCISDYPTRLEDLQFLEYDSTVFVTDLFAEKGIFEGFSDHTMGITAAVVAMSLGARIIEKHFTLDKTLPGPDQVCSADPAELKQLCKMRDDVEKILYKD